MSRPLSLFASAVTLGLAAIGSSPALAQVAPLGGQRVTDVAAVLTGQITGTITDESGQPIDGVVVSALGSTTAFAVSDKTGKFTLGQLPAGPYIVRAHRQGYFASRSAMVNVRPAVRTPSSFTLRKDDDTPRVAEASVGATTVAAAPASGATAERGESELAWRLRHLKRSVLRDADTGLMPAEDDDFFLTDSIEFLGRAVGSSAKAASALFSDLSLGGQVNFLTTGAFDSPVQLLQLDRTSSVAYFSLGAPVGAHGDWTVRAAMNQNDLSSWMLTGSYAVHARVPHRYQVGMSYSLQRYQGGNTAALEAVPDTARNVGSVSAFDEWTVSRRLTIGYGASYAHYDYLADPALFSPRLSASVMLSPVLRVRAAAVRQLSAPGAEEFLPPSRAEYLPPQRTFSTLSKAGDFRAQALQHYEAGIERILNQSSIGARVFTERIDNQLVTVFGLRQPDAAASALGHYRVGSAGDAAVTGVGVTFTHAIFDNVRGSVDYSVSSARWTAPPPAGDYAVLARWVPAAIRPSRERIQDLTTSLQTEVPLTLTRVVVLYKVNDAFVTGDGVDAKPGLGSRFDLQVNQALPFMNFSQSQWEMLVAVRSLFHEGVADLSTYDELLVVRPPKRIVGGITVKF